MDCRLWIVERSPMPLTFRGAVPLDRKPTPWWACWAPAGWPARGPAAAQGTRPTELARRGGEEVSGVGPSGLPSAQFTTKLAEIPGNQSCSGRVYTLDPGLLTLG